ncbi:MAG: BON domain-containing protein, partial [Janthinobacterium lividum]
TGSAEWHAAQGAGPDDWLNAAHAYATISNVSRSGLPSNAAPHAAYQATVTSDAASVTVSLLDDVTKRVMSTDYIDASRIRIAAEDGRVALTGIVADERSKAQIEQLVAGCDGVQGIDNQLRIERAAGDR